MHENRPGTARERLLAAALDLFAEHGVSGTSLQMIADRLGVTKAAVYHQFPTKDEIVLAVIDPALERLEPIAEHAEAQRGHTARRDTVLAGVVDLVVEYRRVSSTLSFDPVVVRLVRSHHALRSLQRIRRLLGGTAPDPGSRVRMAVLSGGLIMAGADPAVAGLDDEDFRDHLLAAARRILRG
ncbi:TetR/AcrR family transcriptional regulator [Actinoplanes sp. CA-142083]|uniref:TetR/AcrR family transcriptional regulator n=1 Tax=Actinoplanes sp. CA-142083 TaxID=3239903 RepID=UPI003D8B6880